MGKTVKQIADELKVNRSVVNRKILELGLQSKLDKVGKAFLLNEEQENLIKESLDVHEDKNDELKNDELKNDELKNDELDLDLNLIHILKQQIKVKDEQIHVLMKQIDQLTTSLQNTTDSLKSAQALHAGTIKQQLSDKTQIANETDKIEIKKHIWKFWKR